MINNLYQDKRVVRSGRRKAVNRKIAVEMNLDAFLKVVDGSYKLICDGNEIENAEKPSEKKFVVESVSAKEGVICIWVKECSSIPNDLNEEWVKEHVEKYGSLPNIFDGC